MECREDLKRGNHPRGAPDHEVYSSGVLPRSPDTDAFWRTFRRGAGLSHDNSVVGSFGDSPKMATELADMVMIGIKRATANLARDYGEGREPMPKPGDIVMMLDRDGRPRFICVPLR